MFSSGKKVLHYWPQTKCFAANLPTADHAAIAATADDCDDVRIGQSAQRHDDVIVQFVRLQFQLSSQEFLDRGRAEEQVLPVLGRSTGKLLGN